MRVLVIGGLALLLAGGGVGIAGAAVLVDLELSMVVDVSGSVSTTEFNTQRDAYEAAFRDTDIQNFILNGTYGKIAANFIYFGSSAHLAVGFTEIGTVGQANAFADAIAAAARPESGSTGIGNGMDLALSTIQSNDFDGTRQVIDVSGDGTNNTGLDPATVRDNALTAGIDAINGLVIGSDSVLLYYQNYVIGGANPYSARVDTFAEFEPGIEEKLIIDITGGIIPEPSTFAIWTLGLLALGWCAWRRRAK